MRRNKYFASLKKLKTRIHRFLKKKKILAKIEYVNNGVKSFLCWSRLQLTGKWGKLSELFKNKKEDWSQRWKKYKKKKKARKKKLKEQRKKKLTHIKGRILDFFRNQKVQFFIRFSSVILGYGLLINYALNYIFDVGMGLQATITFGIIFYFTRYELTRFIKTIQKTPPPRQGGGQQ